MKRRPSIPIRFRGDVPVARRARAVGVVTAIALATAALAPAQQAVGATAAPTTAKPAAAHSTASAAAKKSPFRQTAMTGKAANYYAAVWGVDNLRVASTSSGNLIRFTYRVQEPARASILADRSATPVMYAPRSQAVLQVPVMDKVGPLRQAEGLQAGREYWMVFSNKGQPVKTGDRVDVVVGTFRATGLLVE